LLPLLFGACVRMRVRAFSCMRVCWVLRAMPAPESIEIILVFVLMIVSFIDLAIFVFITFFQHTIH